MRDRLPLRPVDAATLAAVVVFGLLAIALHDSIAGLGDMAVGIRDTGTSIQASGRATAAEIRASSERVAGTLGSLPLVGGEAADAVRDTARRTADAVQRQAHADGQRLVTAGVQGQRDARSTARLVGWLAFLMPVMLVVAIRLVLARR